MLNQLFWWGDWRFIIGYCAQSSEYCYYVGYWKCKGCYFKCGYIQKCYVSSMPSIEVKHLRDPNGNNVFRARPIKGDAASIGFGTLAYHVFNRKTTETRRQKRRCLFGWKRVRVKTCPVIAILLNMIKLIRDGPSSQWAVRASYYWWWSISLALRVALFLSWASFGSFFRWLVWQLLGDYGTRVSNEPASRCLFDECTNTSVIDQTRRNVRRNTCGCSVRWFQHGDAACNLCNLNL